MEFHILTIFPRMLEGPFDDSIIRRARDKGIVTIRVHDIRDYARDRHRVVDDYPYGGGPGMVMKPEPIFEAVDDVRAQVRRGHEGRGVEDDADDTPIILLSPRGRPFNHQVARDLSLHPSLILICGHYEGVDERVRQHLATDEISLGDYVLTGGELAAMVVVDAVVRFLPGALGSQESLDQESHAGGLLEHPQYTRPLEYRGWRVPEVLLSGHHQEIARWRRRQTLLHTLERRPDLLEKAPLTEEERRLIEDSRRGEGSPSEQADSEGS